MIQSDDQDLESGALRGVLTGAMAGWIDEDLVKFFADVESLAGGLREHGGTVRDVLKKRGEIRLSPEGISGFGLGAVDCADVRQVCGNIVTLLALGVRISPTGTPRYLLARKTAGNTDAMRQLAPSLRLQVETTLIAEARGPVIVDNSWWSFLMDTNKMITTHANTPRDEAGPFDEVMQALCGERSTFLGAVYNPDAVAISKSGSSQVISKRPEFRSFFPFPVSDLALFSHILREGEYVEPRLIKEMTEGHAGVEARGWSPADRKKVFDRFRGSNGLHVTFFKPWPFKKAFRIEFDRGRFPEGDRFDALLASIRRETRFPTIIEPVPQLQADRLTKQVASLAKLYGEIHAPRYPELFFSTRTKG